MAETHCQCYFNQETILDKIDHHGKSNVILLNSTKLAGLEHHHKNALILHLEFPKSTHVGADNSYINFFQ
jgi:hypothetical protein